jgi:Holliday junction resolvase
MSQAESNLSRKIMAALRAHGYFCFKVHGGPTMMAGLPDIIVCAQGLFIGLETKMPQTRNEYLPSPRACPWTDSRSTRCGCCSLLSS